MDIGVRTNRVLNTENNQVYVTSQNHGYGIIPESLDQTQNLIYGLIMQMIKQLRESNIKNRIVLQYSFILKQNLVLMIVSSSFEDLKHLMGEEGSSAKK